MPDAPGRITLWGIEVFIATAEERSITAAARLLGASPSAVSQQLTNLETAVGVTLLNRHARPVTLTPAGEILRRRAQVILNEAEQAKAELATADLSALTRFRLGMIEDFEAELTPHLLTHMAEGLRECRFLLETGASHVLHDQLDARALDVIVAAEMGPPAEWMEVHPLLTERFVVAAPRGALDPGGDLLAQLRAMPMVQYSSRHHMGREIASHLARQDLRLATRFELDSYHAVLALVAGGTGWTILNPLGLLRARRFREGLDVFDLPFAPLGRTLALIARRGILREMPAQVALDLKRLLLAHVITPGEEEFPGLRGHIALA